MTIPLPTPGTASGATGVPGATGSARAGRGPWRRGAGPLVTTLMVAVSFFASTVSMAYSADAPGAGTLTNAIAAIGWFYSMGVAAFVVFRKRYPVALTLISCGGAIVFPLDVFGALFGLAHVIESKDRRTSWYLGALTTVAAIVSLGRDWKRPAGSQIFGSTSTDPDPFHTPLWVFVLILAVSVGLSVVVGLLLRARGDVATASTQVVKQAKAADNLRARVVRQDERELIAREVHDALAHRLSLVSLHSGALEVAVPADQPILEEAARVVRENAHASLEDLRDLVALLRDPSGLAARSPGPGGIAPTDLTSIQELVDATRASGVQLVATLVLESAAEASTQLGRAAYRIVQEALTNARKHAPTGRVDVDVRASPARGVRIIVRNALAPNLGVPAPGSRTGLHGLVERAMQLGGRASADANGDSFVVDAWLPWSTRD